MIWSVLMLQGCAVWKLARIERSHPIVAGDLEAPGASAPLRIQRDVHAIPHIFATNEADAWYGLGYVHAQDRLFQLDLTRQTAWGQLSRWFGERTVRYDGFAQALGLRALAKAEVARTSPEARAMLEAYARGINDGAESLRALPIEHRLLNATFEPWLPEDGLAMLFLQAWGLSDNLDYEMAAWSLRDLPAADVDALLRTDPHSPPIDAFFPELAKLDVGPYTGAFTGFVELLGGAPKRRAEASNSWVIGGSNTESGLPIVANDPHLTQRVPSMWYAAHVSGGPLSAAGVTLPGLPAIVIGHSDRLAWGLTNVMADQIDLAVVKRDGDDGYIIGGERKVLRQVLVEVAVRDSEPVTVTVPFTALGPVVSEPADYLMVLQWSALQMEDDLAASSRALAVAASVQELLDQVVGRPMMVTNNLVVADVDGDYAWKVIGSVVGRQSHTGRVPYPAFNEGQGWFGFLEAVPGSSAPEQGFFVTANARPEHPLADAISTSYVPPLRQARIEELLSATEKHTPADSEAIQVDLLEMGAAWHRDRLLDGVVATTERGRECLKILTEWDGYARRDSVGASAWAFFHEAYVRRAISDDIPQNAVPVVLSVASSGRSPLDNGRFEARFVQDRVTTVGVALDDACTRLLALRGPDRTDWSWGAVHPLVLRHPFSSRAPRLLGRWDIPVVPWPGTGATVAVAGHAWGREVDELLPVGVMASVRLVMPLADLSQSTLVYPGGQSGHPMHPDRRTHFVHFGTGLTLPLWTSPLDIDAHQRDLLRLTPRDAR